MYKPEKKHFGFWYNVSTSSFGGILGIEGLVGFCLASGAVFFANRHLKIEDRVSVVNDILSATTGMLGVLFAAFAIVAALMSDGYTRLLNRAEGRIHAFYSLFIIVIGVAVGVILLAIAYKASANHLSLGYELPMFFMLVFLFSYTILNIVALTRNIFAHGVTRAMFLELEENRRSRDEE